MLTRSALKEARHLLSKLQHDTYAEVPADSTIHKLTRAVSDYHDREQGKASSAKQQQQQHHHQQQQQQQQLQHQATGGALLPPFALSALAGKALPRGSEFRWRVKGVSLAHKYADATTLDVTISNAGERALRATMRPGC